MIFRSFIPLAIEMKINSFKITIALFGWLNISMFLLCLWDVNFIANLLDLQVAGERNFLPFLFLTLGLFSLAGSYIKEARTRVMFLLIILLVSLAPLVSNLSDIIQGEAAGIATVSISFMILGLVSLWDQGKYSEKNNN